MASAYHDKKGWTIRYRGLHDPPGKYTKQRVKVTTQGDAEKDEAEGRAEECDVLCRRLERGVTRLDVERAVLLRAINESQGQMLLAKLDLPADATPKAGPLTIEAAALSHPSTAREADKNATEYRRHLRELRIFIEWSGIKLIQHVDMPIVKKYVAHMTVSGLSYDGRRHRLTYLRRACRVAAMNGLPDVMSDVIYDWRDAPPVVEAWTFEELCRGAEALSEQRARVALALGGFVGLRSSEIARVRCGDLSGDDAAGRVLRVGAHGAKNRASQRDLPLPGPVGRWCAELAADRPAEAALIDSRAWQRGGQSLDSPSWGRWLRPLLAKATGRDLAPKCLRKSFATWAVDRGRGRRWS